jgi:hypothetical protein
LYAGSSFSCDGARNAPPGLYTRSSDSPLPGCPYPTPFRSFSPLMLRSNTPAPRWESTLDWE